MIQQVVAIAKTAPFWRTQYWYRGWVIQEVTAQRGTRIQSADTSLQLYSFMPIFELVASVRHWMVGWIGLVDIDILNDFNIVSQTLEMLARAEFSRTNPQSFSNEYGIFLHGFRHVVTTDTRDRIFAFRNVCSLIATIEPDYNSTDDEVLANATWSCV